MRCSSCGRDNREGARFCDGCGASLAGACPDCGTELRAEARFCDGCGRSLEAGRQGPADPRTYTPPHLARRILEERSTVEGERRTVTILFADARGFTPLTEQIGPERAYELVQGCLARMMECVHRYEGTVNQFTGDGIMAIFGAPIAHEDAARRAVSAALDLQASLGEYMDEVKAAHPRIACAFRVGLNTGPVVVGRIGDDLVMDYTAVGDTTNLASRMEGAAEPGAVYLTEATYRAVEDFVECEVVGELDIKGKSEPVRTYRAVREKAVRTRFEAAASRGLTPFVGRTRELEVLRGHLAQARSGRGQIVFVSGEAGIGKSRFLLELRRLVPEGTTWWQGQCSSYGEGIPYLPVVDVVKDAFGIREDDDPAAVIDRVDRGTASWAPEAQKTVPYLKFLLQVDPGDPGVEHQDPMERRAGILDGLRALFAETAREETLAVAIEDVHWADEHSIGALRALVDVVEASGVLLVITFRPGYDHGLEGLARANRLVLGELASEESAAMADGVLSSADLSPELAELITSRAEGNPLFIEEVTKALVEMGVLTRRGEGYEVTRPVSEVEVPDTIQEVILSRIDRLEAEAKEALQLASVIGREFTVRLLGRIADLRAELEGVLGELKGLELIYETAFFPELAYMFKHALTHDVAYSTLLDERRKALHRIVAAAVEELYADRLAEHYEVLAHHYLEGEVWDKALDYLEKAGDKAEAAFATAEALDFYGRAIDLLEHLADDSVPRIAGVSQQRTYLLQGLGRFPEAVVEAERMVTIVGRVDDPVLEGSALAVRGIAETFEHDFDSAEETLQRAIELTEGAPDEPWVFARVARLLGDAILGKLDRFSELWRQIEPRLDPSADPFSTAEASLIVGIFENWCGRYDEAVARAHRGIEAGEMTGTLVVRFGNTWTQALALAGRGSYEEARRLLEGIVDEAERFGEVNYLARSMNTLGWICNELQDFEGGIEWNSRDLEFALAAGFPDPEIESNARLNLADAYIELGRLDRAQEQLDHVERVVRDPSPQERWALWTYAQHLCATSADLWLAKGDPERALAYADECIERATSTGRQKNVVKGRRARGVALMALGDLSGAEEELTEALAVAVEVGNPPQLWKTHAAMGDLRRAQGRDEEARASFEAALIVIDGVAEGLTDARRRETFLGSDEVRRLREAATVAP